MPESRTASAEAGDAPPAPHTVHAGRESLDDGVRILKHGDTFAVFDRHGDAHAGRSSHGIYHEGTRHLSHLILEIGGDRPLLLKSTISPDNLLLAIDLTNPDLGAASIAEADTVHIFRGRIVRDAVVHEKLRLTNHGMSSITFAVTWRFGADFADLFEVRGMQRLRRGKRLEPELRSDGARLSYRGLDGVTRRTDLVCSPLPDRITGSEVRFEISLAPKEERTIELQILCEGERRRLRPRPLPFRTVCDTLSSQFLSERARGPGILGSSQRFNRWIERGVADLLMMSTETEHGPYPYAGIPWYSTAFGRDGIITAMSVLWMDPAVARGVLRFLAATQARETDDTIDARPGKIVHEMRHGEMAALREVPFARYYGTVDATPLFVVLAGAYYRRTADLSTIEELWPNLRLALEWIDGEDLGGEFLRYERRSKNGLVHQGWKDSDVSVFHSDGRLATGPIALCEVQGYVYAARRAGAELARLLREDRLAARLEGAAERLRLAFEETFWIEGLGTYALALCGDDELCRVKTSNPGHCLWSGIVAPDRARRLATTLMDDSMFSGWGMRTVATSEVRYNPLSYHNGSVWPHDNAIVAAGLSRYGMKEEAQRIFSALFDAGQHMDHLRMPELFCGFSRKAQQGPTLYPVACSPQAWAATSPLLLLQAVLGLELDATAKQVRFHDPRLPEFLEWLELTGLHVGDATVDVMVRRDHDGPTIVDVLDVQGDATVVTV